MIDKIREDIEKYLDSERYTHTMNVVKEALTLSELYGEDLEKAKTAALLHDIGKASEIEQLLNSEEQFDIILKENLKTNRALYHAVASRRIAVERYGILDKDILNAIRFHTTSRANMSRLEKIIYIADSTEIGRSFEGVDELRRLSRIDLDSCMLLVLDNSIKHVLSKKLILHEYTLQARNYIIAKADGLGVEE